MFNAGRLLALKELLKSIPTGVGWWTQESLDTGDPGVLMKAISNDVGDWLNSVYETRKSTYLKEATGTDLDIWGLDLKVPRKIAEPDNTYRARLIAQILAKKLTKPAIEEFLLTELGINTNVYLPWKDIAIYDYGYDSYLPDGTNLVAGRSGTKKRSSSYYMAGVIDVQTDDFDVRIKDIVNNIKGAPIKPYYTPRVTGGGTVVVGTNSVIGDYLLTYLAYVSPTALAPLYFGYGQVRSGGEESRVSNIKLSLHLTNTTNGLKQRLFNDPAVTNLDFRATSQTWESVADLTWDQLLLGHDRQVSSPVVIYNYSQLYDSGTYGAPLYG